MLSNTNDFLEIPQQGNCPSKTIYKCSEEAHNLKLLELDNPTTIKAHKSSTITPIIAKSTVDTNIWHDMTQYKRLTLQHSWDEFQYVNYDHHFTNFTSKN